MFKKDSIIKVKKDYKEKEYPQIYRIKNIFRQKLKSIELFLEMLLSWNTAELFIREKI